METSQKNNLFLILCLGIILRISVFFFQGPFNNDPHYPVVQFIHEHHALPDATQCWEAYHPPLYYAVASLFVTDNPKTVQAFSLFLSIATLVVICIWIWETDLIPNFNSKKHCLLLAAALPELVLFGNFISNDPLCFLIGALIFYQMFDLLRKPGWIRQNLLAVTLALGLLTKGTFLAFVPPLVLLVLLVHIRNKSGWKKTLGGVLLFCAIVSALGSYKYVENYRKSGSAFITNVSAALRQRQGSTYAGPSSFYDANILKLVKHPVVSEFTRHSYPLLLYGTLWYQYIPESSLRGNLTPLNCLGSCIYLLALIPTVLFLLGFFSLISRIGCLFHVRRLGDEEFRTAAYHFTALALLVSNTAIIFALGLKHDIWSWFQSRYLFTSLPAILLLFNAGLKLLERAPDEVRFAVNAGLVGLYSAFILYFGTEIIGHIAGVLPKFIPF